MFQLNTQRHIHLTINSVSQLSTNEDVFKAECRYEESDPSNSEMSYNKNKIVKKYSFDFNTEKIHIRQ